MTQLSTRVLEVGFDKPYQTIQGAVDDAEDGDTVLVGPGTYREKVFCKKFLSIIGTSPEECTLIESDGDYFNPPLQIMKGVLKNMTVYAELGEQVAPYLAYSMHCDYDFGEDSSLYVENCHFTGERYQVVGIGLRRNYTMEYVNCKFECMAGNNAFYCHDDPVNPDATGQKLIVRNCTFINNGERHTVLMQSQENKGARTDVTWVNNTVINRACPDRLLGMVKYNASLDIENWLGSADWFLTPESSGNTVPEMNY